MILKWIRCTVPNKSRDAFSKAQEGWSEVKKSKGFIKQVGGWHKKKKNVAHIFVYWDSLENLDYFMKHQHDTIYNKIRQEQTYTNSIVDVQEGNADYLNWFVERQKVKFVEDWNM